MENITVKYALFSRPFLDHVFLFHKIFTFFWKFVIFAEKYFYWLKSSTAFVTNLFSLSFDMTWVVFRNFKLFTTCLSDSCVHCKVMFPAVSKTQNPPQETHVFLVAKLVSFQNNEHSDSKCSVFTGKVSRFFCTAWFCSIKWRATM